MTTDADFFGLTPLDADGHFRFVVGEHLARMDARLYGGTAIGVSLTAAEAVSQRQALWMTTQFVSTVAQDASVDVHAEVLAPGRRTNQVRVTGTSADGTTVFASLGATGHHRDGGMAGEFERRPTVDRPDASDQWESPFSALARQAGFGEPPAMPRDTGFTKLIEMRGAPISDHPDPGPGRVCVWVRRRDGVAITPAMAAFVADMVPMSVALAFGVFAGGTSLDNTIRIGEFEESEWVLLDLRPHGAVGDYGHGVAHVWSEQGRWMATASQTAAMRRFDPQDAPWSAATPST
ncbi:MAG: acyl-CoA thioesterase [Acidimicrobiales bacterium]